MHIHGVPRPVVTWWRGMFEIKPNVKFTKLEEAHGVYKLLIYKPNNRDSGAYLCKAINSSGEAQITHSIEVGKNLHYHIPGIFHARGRLSKVKEEEARKAMEEAMKSKGDSDRRRAEAAAEARSRAPRASPEPIVAAKQKTTIRHPAKRSHGPRGYQCTFRLHRHWSFAQLPLDEG